ncbi:MAG TPA: TadE/TadG family type IV pilus assembly protein [Gemmataceae bacterium]|nr:TadE/TadG family type IV pilus assembly protein [Gemmataceae bacterium]
MPTRTRRPRGGAAAVELAALLPFLLFLAVIATDWARLLNHTITIEQAARCGGVYAADEVTQSESRYYDPDVNKAVEAIVRAEASGLDQSKLPAPTVTKFIGPDGKPMVQVTVQYNFASLTNFPGVPGNQTLTRHVTMRVYPVTPN